MSACSPCCWPCWPAACSPGSSWARAARRAWATCSTAPRTRPREAASLSAGTGVALSGEKGRPRPRGTAEGAPEDEGPKAPTFPASEGVSGRVIDARRQPIAKAQVTLHPYPLNTWWNAADATAVAETQSAKDGTFLVGPAPEVRLKVRAVAPGFAPSVVVVPRRGGRVELVLDVGGGLVVKVLDVKGTPIADASVQHLAGAWGAQVTSEAVTDKEGVARFESVPTGSGQVVVTKSGLGLVRQPDVGVPPQQVTELTVVLQGGRTLAGQVVNGDDQRPIVGVSLEVHYPWVQGVKPSAPVLSDENGRYQVPIDVPTGEQFELRARHAEFAETRLWLNYNDNGTGTMKHDLRLGQGAQGLTGRVVARDGGGLAGVTVTYGNAQPGQELPRTQTDGEGRFELAAPLWGGPGTSWMVLAVHPREGVGYAHAALPKPNEARGKALEIRLAGSGSIAGVVKDGAGQPVTGAAISVAPDWNSMQGGGRGGRRFDWQMMNVLQDPNVGGRLTAVSDAEGRYTIEGVPLAIYQVTALWGGLSATHDAPVDVKPGDTARADLTLGEGSTIEGVVLDGEDRPIAGAMLWAQPMQQRPGSVPVYPMARSQSDGRFVLRGVGSGAYQINASAAGYGQDVVRNVEAGTRDATVRLKSMGWIDGQVLLDNQPYVGTFTVLVKRVGGGGSSNMRSMRGGGEDGGEEEQVFNHPEGVFQRRGMQGGEYRVSARTNDGLVMLEPVVVNVAEGRGAGPVRLALQRGASIVGVVEGSNGRPLKGAWIQAGAAPGAGEGPDASARTDETGAFALQGLGSGTYRVTIHNDQGGWWMEQVDVVPGQERRVRFQEQVPGRVRVTVQDADGQRLAKARPQLTDAGGTELHPNWQLMRRDSLIDGRTDDSWQRATSTDENGQCTRHHIPPGRYRVTALLPGHEAEGEGTWVDVAANAITDVTITLKPGSR